MEIQDFRERLKAHYLAEEADAIYRLLQADGVVPDREMIFRLMRQEPIQYILGYAWFLDRKLEVNEHTLIPRPETEELCSLIIKEMGETPGRMMDVGTGSGCIAISLALANPANRVIAMDVSENALLVTERNISAHGLNYRVKIRRQDFLNEDAFPTDLDLIVSNPPYISHAEMSTMDSRVLDWEPHLALFPEGADTLVFYRRLAQMLQQQANPNCVLWAEINASLENEVLGLFAEGSAMVLKDMSGNPRFLRAKKEGTRPSFING